MQGSRRKGRQGTGAHAKGSQLHTTFIDRRAGHGHLNQSHFSLQDEAQNTERQHIWGSATQLRHARISFVSSGRYDGEEVTQTSRSGEIQAVPLREASSTAQDPSLETSMTGMSLSVHDRVGILDHGMQDDSQQNVKHLNGDHNSDAVKMSQDKVTNSHDVFVIDGQGNSAKHSTGFPEPKILERSSSPTPSASSEDVIVFKGRRNVVPSSSSKKTYRRHVVSVEDPPSAATVGVSPRVSAIATKDGLETTPVSNNATLHRGPSRKPKSGAEASHQLEESLLADYIANMDSSHATTTVADEFECDAHMGSGIQVPLYPQNGIQGGLEQIDDTRDLLRASAGDRAPVMWSEADDSAYSTDSSSEDDRKDDLQWEVQNIIAEEDRLYHKNTKMTDAQIARLLAKQEELGLGSDEVVLFDSAGGIDSSSFMTLSKDHRTSAKRNNRKDRRTRRSELRSTGDRLDFTADELFRDIAPHEPYYGYDPMDFERTSLQRKRKGRKEALDFDLSDSDLAVQMAATWNTDRAKKKSRKEERQRQREDGQATGASGTGGLADAKCQIRAFLQSEKTSISFPPMNKRDRRALHELANRLTLMSKSHGTGHERFPVLYRTKRTPNLSDDDFDRVVEQLSRRFSNLRASKPPKRNTIGVGRNGGYSHAAVSCRDGEVVGAGAAELGQENRGRAMLEKMGWSTGTAIGALNNKGIMQPVVHIVKTTKAGLG